MRRAKMLTCDTTHHHKWMHNLTVLILHCWSKKMWHFVLTKASLANLAENQTDLFKLLQCFNQTQIFPTLVAKVCLAVNEEIQNLLKASSERMALSKVQCNYQ